MLENLLHAFDTGTPPADHTEENVVRYIGAIFAFSHILMKFG